jgi:hypothetical protein
MFFVVRVNMALASLGIDPRWIQPSYRKAGQQLGKALGYTPQEVALFITGQLPAEYMGQANPVVAQRWILDRKVDLSKADTQTAIRRLNWDSLPGFSLGKS